MARKKAETKPEITQEPTAEVEVKEEVREVKSSEPEAPPTGKPYHRERLARINEIAKANQEARDNENANEDVEAANEAAQEEEKETVETRTEVPEEKPKRKFIVDGKEVELTDDEIVEHVQRSATADTRFREASRLFEEARKTTPTRQDASRFTPTQEHTPSPGPLPGASPDAGQTDKLVGELTTAIVGGDQEAIAKALKLALTQPGVTPERAQAIALETNAFLQAKQLLEDPPEKGGFSDIYSDPVLKTRFESRENELRDAGDQRPYRELYSSIGTEIRKWRDDLISKHIPKTGLEDRDSLKAKTGVVRGAGGKVPSPEVTLPKSERDKHNAALESQRRARGLN